MKLSYAIVHTEPFAIWLEDVSHVTGGMSITNSAEEVIQDLLKSGLITAGKRVYYTDTDGVTDELCHDGSEFTGFSLGVDRRL